MPVWGYRFVSQFLEFCLPTLLAPGNIPWVAGVTACRFVLLSSEEQAPLIRSHPAWAELERHCAAEIRPIDDLITDGNHTATITLAFARAVRETGDAMLETCFVFLQADYLFATGSLQTVVSRIREGASGVLAGNYQIVAEDAIPLLRRRIDPGSPAIALSARELVRWSLAHLHPATVANIVNFGLSHNAHVNRLFWRVDENTMIGRFYLMHMIAIRPEVTNFVVGASSDYSFIPEMCPSGNVVAVTDSDDYLVVEMQPRNHETRNLMPGPLDVHELAESLSEWTTADHRRNVDRTLVYHADEIPTALPRFVAEADAFIDRVRTLLAPEPQPHRHHHYWIGSLAVNRARSRRPLGRADWEFLLGEAMPTGGLSGLLWRLRAAVLGSVPDVTRFHPRWPDYGLPLKAIRQVTGEGRLLLIAPRPLAYAQWLTRAATEIETLEPDRLIELPRDLYIPLVGRFDCCLMVLTEDQLERADELVARVGPLLGASGRIMVTITNDRSMERAPEFGSAFARHSARFINPAAWLAEVHYVPASRLRWSIYRATTRVARRAGASGWRSPASLAPVAFVAGPLLLAAYLCNLRTRATTTPPSGLWSSVFLILRRVKGASIPFPLFPQQRGAAESASADDVSDSDPDRHGGEMARYRFVAGLLSGRSDVAEYGAPNVSGNRLVMSRCKKFSIYDPDPFRVAEALRDRPPEFSLAAHVHDILSGPLPRRHDAIYSLDSMQKISHSDEDIYVCNLRDSLNGDGGILIVGTPSFGASGGGKTAPSDATRTPASECSGSILAPAPFHPANGSPQPTPVLRSAAEMRALFERFFHSVFAFSVIEDTVHVGDLPNADYVFALCCHRQDRS
jgi:hypothetical protein